jgi:excinuclease ABC subunit C
MVETEHSQKLRGRLRQVPERPGVYLLKDGSGRVLYVGKAGNLKNRLTSHIVRGSADQPRLEAAYSKLEDFEYIVTGSEMEALILEANLVKLHLPRYNIRLKDDKKYPYIKVTTNEPYPRVFPTRDLTRDGAVLFGPYTNAKSMRKALNAVTRIFPLRTCKGKMPRTLCLDYQIRRCYGPCEKKIAKSEYRYMVAQLIRFLSGKDTEVEKALEKKMGEASRRLDFEAAARFRDQLLAVRDTIRRQRVVFRDRVDRDVIGTSRYRGSACVALLQIRDGKLIARESYMLHAQATAGDDELLRSFLGQYYKNAFFIPREIVLPVSVPDEGLFASWLTRKRGSKVRLLVPKRGEKVRILELARMNAKHELAKSVSLKKDRAVSAAVLELAQALKLDNPPRRIEAFDISNTGGKQSVGSLVVFDNGKARKDAYRRFRIRTVEGQDDFAMMREVVERRFKRLKNEGKPSPDLVLIDGGIGQLNSAREAVEKYFTNVPVYGLAKRMDELYLPDGKKVMLPKGSASLHLLQRLRDEAHRFAIAYHRKLRGKKMRQSTLDDVRGLGEKRKKELLRYFGSVEKMKTATIEDIARVKHIGPKIAARVYEGLHQP